MTPPNSRGPIRSYRDLVVWQRAMQVVVEVHVLTREFAKGEAYGLTSQLRRAAVSIPSNIAEGHARGTGREYAHFVSIARGSVAELETQLELSVRLDMAPDERVARARQLTAQVGQMLTRLSQRLRERTNATRATHHEKESGPAR